MVTLSILVVTKNCESDLRKTLASINGHQSSLKKNEVEILFVDGYSTDGTVSTIDRFLKYGDFNGRIIQQKPNGIYPAMNLAVSQAKGLWNLFLNAGDLFVLSNTCLIDILRRYDRYKGVQFKVGLLEPITNIYFKPKSCHFAHQGFIYKKSLHGEFGYYSTHYRLSSDRIFAKSIPSHYCANCDMLLTITQVTPRNASRSPHLVMNERRLFVSEQVTSLKFRYSSSVGISILWVEYMLQFSIVFWLRCIIKTISGRLTCHRYFSVTK